MAGNKLFSHKVVKRIKPCLILFSAIAVVLLTMSSSSFAAVSDISISPENPNPGDTMVITGTADSYEEIPFAISFESTQDVSDGEYKYNLGKIKIPDDAESFGLRAKSVDTLKVSVSLFGIPISIPDSLISYSGDSAYFGTGKINSGTYDITLSGTSSSDEVNFSFDSRGTITADEDGNIEYSYITDNMPEGTYYINLGGQNREVAMGSGVRTRSQGSSKTGTEFTIREAAASGTERTDDDVEFSTTDDVLPESLDSTSDTGVEEGTVVESPSLKNLGIAGVFIGIFLITAIFLAIRKNKV